MATKRKKSANDIRAQLQRIQSHYGSQINDIYGTRSSRHGSVTNYDDNNLTDSQRNRVTDIGNRTQRAYNAANRYLANIAHKRGKAEEVSTPLGNKYTRLTVDNDRKYSRSTYMGTNNG